MNPPLPCILVLGPTASGKSDLAVEIARRVQGEIVSGDAFSLYRGLDIGTAKPSEKIRREIFHHLIDVAEPTEHFSAGRWAALARRAADEIGARGHVPVVAGGSHFYIRALLGGLPGEEVANLALRRYFAARRGPAARQARKAALDLLDPEYSGKVAGGDTARLDRALEVIFSTGAPVSRRQVRPDSWRSGWRFLKIAIQISREELYTRIKARVGQMWGAGWPAEVRSLLAAGIPESSHVFSAIGYREVAAFIRGELSREEAVLRIIRKTRELAKRQMTWLAAERDLNFVTAPEAACLAADFCTKGAL